MDSMTRQRIYNNKIRNAIVCAIIVITGIFYFSTIREGHPWGDDFSAYISHAKNIVKGIDYKATGYIYNPFYPSFGPRVYPPVFPLLLAPLYKYYGLNLTPMKIENVLIFLLFLLLLYLIFKKELSFTHLAVMLVIIGFNPFFWDFKDNIVSDIPFLFFLYLSLLVISKAHGTNGPKRFNLIYPVLAGFFIYISYGTRNVGFFLLPCLFIYDIIKFKKISVFSIISALTFLIFFILQSVFLYADTSYSDQFSVKSQVILNNLYAYSCALSDIWANGYNKMFKYLLFAVFSIFSFIGYAARIKRGITVFEIFSVLYLTLVIIWPAHQGARFLIPVIPLYIFYVFIGIENFFINQKGAQKLIFAITAAAIFVSYIGKYTTLDYGYIREGIGKKETKELFDYIRNNTQKNDIFIFQKPRALALYTGRNASVYHCPSDYRELCKYFKGIKASYLIAGEPFDADRTYLRLFVERYRNYLEIVYSNQDFKVYKIKTLPL